MLRVYALSYSQAPRGFYFLTKLLLTIYYYYDYNNIELRNETMININDLSKIPTESLIDLMQDYRKNFWAYWDAMTVIDACLFMQKVREELHKRIEIKGSIIL